VEENETSLTVETDRDIAAHEGRSDDLVFAVPRNSLGALVPGPNVSVGAEPDDDVFLNLTNE